MELPFEICSGEWRTGSHVQGIAFDSDGGCMYYSFTTHLIKTDLTGRPLGSVKNLTGHLGCISFDKKRRLAVGSLEFKHDAIGRGIAAATGREIAEEDAFYAVAFDADRITRFDMDAERDSVMRAVYLCDVVRDYAETDEVSGQKHRYGCSGIDGTGVGPAFGTGGQGNEKLMIAYGIYGDVARRDNDHQVILQYDPDIFDTYGRPLDQRAPHHSGPTAAEARYFVYTGNTRYGIQNLEYDPASGLWLAAVYTGKKPGFANAPLYFIDGKKPPVSGVLRGREPETGLLLTLSGRNRKPAAGLDCGGVAFPLGSTGIAAVGDGSFYFSDERSDFANGVFSTRVRLFYMDDDAPTGFTEAKTRG